MAKKDKTKQISTALFYKRIAEISDIKQAFETGQPIKSSNLSKVGYILWQHPETRESDITLALKYYKVFHKDLVHDETISFRNMYKLPKMYDIQRDRAKIQNDYKLFPASQEIQRRRKDRSDEYSKYYLIEKAHELCTTAEYSIFFDESGKEDTFFILAGVSVDENAINLDDYRQQLLKIKSELCKKYNVKNEELKFGNIKASNFEFHMELINKIFELDFKPVFYSICIDNKGLKQHTKKIRTDKLLEIMLLEALNPIIQNATRNSLLNSLVNLNVYLDIDGDSPDVIEAKTKENNLQNELNGRYKYFASINTLQWLDSKENIFIQLADLYASSLNNVFSEKPAETSTAKAKKDFACFFMSKVGIKDIYQEAENNFTFYNKALVKFDSV